MNTNINESLYKKYLSCRRVTYDNSDVRQKWIIAREMIHDIVRRGACKVLSSPTTIHLAPTSACNLSCDHCYYDFSGTAFALPFNTIIRVIEEAADMGVHEIVLEGGEPFCYPDILRLVKLIKEKGMAIDFLTNGTLLQNDLVLQLIELLDPKLDAFQISIDGPKDVHDKIRGVGAYQKSMCGANLVSKVWKNVRVNCVYRGMSMSELRALCSDISKYTNIHILHFSPLLPLGRAVTNTESHTPEEIVTYMSMLIELKSEFEERLLITGSFIEDASLYSLVGDNASKHGGVCGCCAARTKLYINADGNVYPCAFLADQSFLSGNIYNNSLHEIWEKCNPTLRENLTMNSLLVNSTATIFKCPAVGGIKND